MIELDWINHALHPAPRTLLCQFRRPQWNRPVVCYITDFLPDRNVTDLEWRLTGIAREQLDWMPEEVREQVMGSPLGWLTAMMNQVEALGPMRQGGIGQRAGLGSLMTSI
jgi:hypothetical protein